MKSHSIKAWRQHKTVTQTTMYGCIEDGCTLRVNCIVTAVDTVNGRLSSMLIPSSPRKTLKCHWSQTWHAPSTVCARSFQQLSEEFQAGTPHLHAASCTQPLVLNNKKIIMMIIIITVINLQSTGVDKIWSSGCCCTEAYRKPRVFRNLILTLQFHFYFSRMSSNVWHQSPTSPLSHLLYSMHITQVT